MSWPRRRTEELYAFDEAVRATQAGALVGIDEAGRGPLAGPVVAAAVRLDPDRPIEGIDDSKRLTAKKREALYECITAQAVAWAVARATPAEIDRLNILQATFVAMRRALDCVGNGWSLALVDGNRPIGSLPAERQRCIVGGDGRSACIAAASIVAKVSRDRMMSQYDRDYPLYHFAEHKGYGTAAHRSMIRRHGLCEIHRRSFCEKVLAQTSLALEGPAGKG